ncbi:DNA-binding transcriptional regulator, LysR family [Modicisalibacter muralis]|uniref:DNA-binding transcriptional regulator, LysR family n=1 Tax=Modicisalibacter muralis TaxID=119000 RepID=A0A1G9M766_9GAMM|nr:LysR substrate-binding domain-containing protein [Halomonas muralis]SDL69963.1 DNA-binding transcriptional regulator, LysR family [Halomonas muralis]
MTVARPSLNALRAFETSVRLGNMSRAADELGVTPSAISRHIQSLESIFGVPLLKRLPQSVIATDEGARMAAKLSDGFNLIEASVAQFKPGPLTLSCSATIMMHWLIPRLRHFKQTHPNVDLRLNVNYADIDLVREEISLAIRNDMVPPPQDVIVKHLMNEEIGLVCAPGYLKAAGLEARLEDLPKARILAAKTRLFAWNDWLETMGRPEIALAPHDIYEHFYLMIQAASYGLGVAIAPRMIVEDEISSGRLVAPFGFIAGKFNIVLWIAPHLRKSKDLQALVKWTMHEVGNTDRALPNAKGR